MKFKILSQKGVTLIEILIAALLTLVVGTAALEFYVVQHNQWLVQEDISDMQQNVRVALDEITTNVRKAGFGIPAGHPSILVDTDSITIFYKDSIKIDTISYYVSWVDSLHPNLMKRVNSHYPTIFAENIESLTFQQNDKLITLTIVAREQRKDPQYTGDKYRRRTLVSKAEVRNRV